jgi:hypothetical protein
MDSRAGNQSSSKKEARRFFGYSEDDEMSDLEDQLGELAAKWRGNQLEEYVTEYHRVLHELLSVGWTNYLDADARLPTRLMPKEYFDRNS